MKAEIKTQALDNCMRVIGYWFSGDKSVIEELIENHVASWTIYGEPFAKELNYNLLNRESETGKRDIIAHCLDELKRVREFFEENEENLRVDWVRYVFKDGVYIIGTKNSGEEVIFNQYLSYAQLCKEVFISLVNQIKYCCKKFKINFIEICHDVDFPIDIFGKDLFISENENGTIQLGKSCEVAKTTDISVKDFFNTIKEGHITQIEIHNKIQELTNNFDFFKLQLLLDDFEFYLYMAKEERLAECTEDEIFAEIDRFSKAKKDIPYLKIYELVKTETGYKKVEKKDSKVIDTEKLLYQTEFFFCYQFKGLLNHEIEERESDTPKKTTVVPVGIKMFDDLPQTTTTFILKMLEDLSITVNGKPELGLRKKSALRGIVEASLDKSILPQQNLHLLCKLIGDKIGLDITSKLGDTYTSKEMRKKAVKYISEKYNP